MPAFIYQAQNQMQLLHSGGQLGHTTTCTATLSIIVLPHLQAKTNPSPSSMAGKSWAVFGSDGLEWYVFADRSPLEFRDDPVTARDFYNEPKL